MTTWRTTFLTARWCEGGMLEPATAARSRRAVPGSGAGMWRSSLRSDSAAVLGPRAHGVTRSVRCAHCARTDAVSQMTKRASTRAALGPVLLAAPLQRPCQAPPGAQGPVLALPRVQTPVVAKAWAAGWVWGASGAARSAGFVARARTRAHQALTHVVCSSAVSEANGASYAVGPQARAPQRSLSAAKTAPAKPHTQPAAHAFARAEKRAHQP
jgi:hypothetical protein